MRINFVLPTVLLVCATVAHAAPAIKPACTLLTQQAATALYGGPVTGGQGLGGGIMSTCAYTGKNNDSVALAILAIPQHMDPNQAFDMPYKNDPKIKTEPVSGLGERAMYIVRGKEMTGLVVLSHSATYTLAVDHPDSPALRAALMSAMKEILAKS